MELSRHKAVILAGGQGTRLYPITREIPKPLLPIAKKPIINYLVDLFFSHGVKDIAVLVSKEFEDDFSWWRKRYYPEVSLDLFPEETPLGTFGGLWHLQDWLGHQPFFLTNGDELKEINLKDMVSFHNVSQALGTLALVEVPNPQDYGVVVCDSDMVTEFLEKPQNPPSSYINSGLYVFSPEIFQYHPGPKFTMVERDIFPVLAKERKLAGFKFQGKWTDCGTWERYEEALHVWKLKEEMP